MPKGKHGVHAICLIDGCESEAKGFGWCSKHYRRWWKTGDPLGMLRSPYAGKECAIEDCHSVAYCRGWCQAHYARWFRHGDPLGGRVVNPRWEPQQRLWARVNKNGPLEPTSPNGEPCWHWEGATVKGHGWMTVDGKRIYVHRLAYELLVGPIPDGFDVDHVCHNVDPDCPAGVVCLHRRCVNPAHLEAVTPSENNARGKRRMRALITHCPHGHEYTPDNSYFNGSGSRSCLACKKENERRQVARRSAERRAEREAAA